MKREIKFRGQRIDGEGWIYGYYMENHMNKAYQSMFSINKEVVYQIYPKGCDVLPREVLPETIGQYTGYKDKNGKEIYEGDIVTYLTENKGCFELEECEQVVFEQGAWRALYPLYLAQKIEINGNIHETPELLK